MYVGIDIGGTNGRVAAFKSLDDPAPVARHDFAVSGDYTQELAAIVAAVQKVSGGKAPQGIGLAIAGAVDAAAGRVISKGMPWSGQPLRDDVAKQCGAPVTLINDAAAAALAEATFGGGKGEDFWFIIWGTGIGGSLVRYRDGQPIVQPGEPGHQVVNPGAGGEPDGCGRVGCLESLAAGRGIESRYSKPAAELSESEWQEVCEHFAQGLANILSIQPVAQVVFGGGIAAKQAKRLPAIARLLENELDIAPAPTLALTTLGEDAGLAGALAALRTV